MRGTGGADAGVAWPRPFCAGLALSTDIDDSTPESFAFHQRLFGDGLIREERARYGEPLRWPGFADSLFAVVASPQGRARGQISIFEDPEGKRESPHAPALAQAVREGRIDCLHGWGDFNGVGGFTRAVAERTVAWLRRERLALPLFVHHGNPRDNPQGYGDVSPHLRGDDPAAGDLYTLDLAREAGIRYVWCGDLRPLPGLGGTPYPVGERLAPVDLDRPARARAAALALAAVHDATGAAAPRKACHRLGWDLFRDNRLWRRARMRDGTEATVFARVGRWERADWTGLAWCLSPERLDALVRHGGAAIVYTHLGKGGPTPAALAALRGVLARNARGEIWIGSVPALLDLATGPR